MSEYGYRVSRPFKSKEEAIETLRKGGLHEQILEEFATHNHVVSIIFGASGGVRALGVEIDKALSKANAECPTGDVCLFHN